MRSVCQPVTFNVCLVLQTTTFLPKHPFHQESIVVVECNVNSSMTKYKRPVRYIQQGQTTNAAVETRNDQRKRLERAVGLG